MDDQLKTIDIVQIIGSQKKIQRDVVVNETPLTIFINDQELVTLLCSPTHLKSLAVGFLFSEGILIRRAEIENILLNESKGVVWFTLKHEFKIDENFSKGRTVTSGCARGLTFHNIFNEKNNEFINSKLTISSKVITSISSDLKCQSAMFQKSGGAHCASLYEQENFLFSREDIGRHNAVDKIIGECFIKAIVGDNKILMTSGRVSSEILLKAARWKIPILVSRTAPTFAAIKIAEELGSTLIGFARGERMNVYTNSWRIE